MLLLISFSVCRQVDNVLIHCSAAVLVISVSLKLEKNIPLSIKVWQCRLSSELTNV